MKVLINVGGKGTRMGETGIPKALIEVNGKPILEHQILHLKKYGLNEIILATGYLSEKIEEYFKDGKRFGVKIIYSKEDKPLGTAGPMKLAEKFLGEEFMVLQGDLFIDFDVKRFVDFHREKKSIGTIFVHESSHPYDSDLIELDENKIIKRVFMVKEGEKFENLTNAGVFIFSNRVLKYIPNSFFNMEKDLYSMLLKNNEKIYGYHSEEFVKDIGTLERLNEVEDYLKRPGAIFLDRDGVINEDLPDINRIGDFKFIPRSVDGLKLLKDKKTIIITNQPVIGKGIITEDEYLRLQGQILEKIKRENVKIDEIYYCPHHPEKGIGKYKIDCNCRKPKSGMLKKASNDLGINLSKSWVIGDKRSDIKCGKSVGCRTILVKTGSGGMGGNTDFEIKPDFVVDDLYEAVELILKEDGNN